MQLDAQTVRVRDLAPAQVARMLHLMQAHYVGVIEDQFMADLQEKTWVILLLDRGEIQGFSTQVVFDYEFKGRTLKILFSGDTVIDKSHWGSLALPVAWGRLMLSILAGQPQQELYWLLISKGYKTYRFLSVFFREYYPCIHATTPAYEQALLESVAANRFGERFDPKAGVLRALPEGQRLREGVADIDPQHLHKAEVAFFQQINPGHVRGDELVCLARADPENLTAYIRRQL